MKNTNNPSFQRRALITIIGILLYGGLSWVTNIFLAGDQGIEIRPGVAVPIFVGLSFGPLAGFLVGFLGNFLGDFLTGWFIYPLDPSTGNTLLDMAKGFFLQWQLGNGLMGAIAGLATLHSFRYATVKDYLRAFVYSAAAILLGMGLASSIHIYFWGLSMRDGFMDLFLPVVRVNLVNATILVPILLYNRQHLDLSSTTWIQSGMMRRLSVAILLSAALPVVLLGFFFVQGTGKAIEPSELTVKLIFTVIATLIFTIANAGLLAQNMSRPLLRLTEAARTMENGKLTSAQANDLRTTTGTDEISGLSQMFGRMAHEVIQREESLRQQVQELRIEIDNTKRARQVSEITDSDYFRELQEKIKKMREKGSS
ncbi:MAG: ECF transporter S component [Anaerolineales bacterium]|nr:ECF transporter S component [Anaerolineales bacterium]